MIEPVTVLGQPAMRLVAPDGAEATVLLRGAQVVSWIPAGDQERLYLSPQAVAGPGQAVRGGIPVIFPQFNTRGPLPRHGFARLRAWAWAEQAERGGAAIGVLQLEADDATRALWPHGFSAELTVVVSGLQLDLELAVTNTGDTPIELQAALHTYLRLDDLRRARLTGLFGAEYEDMLDKGAVRRQEFDPQSFVGEIDRLYRGVRWPLTLASGFGHMALDSEGFDDVVVWNPGAVGAAEIADLPAADWPAFLCIEAAQVAQPARLAPGESWVARHTLAA
jgi:glucose-6-phosphate 1-epimerase